MVKLSVLLVSAAATLFAAMPVLAQTPEACVEPCESIARIEACHDEDMSCVCGEQILIDSQECRKCVIDADITTSLVPGFNEILTLHSEICKEAIAALTPETTSDTSRSTTPTNTNAPQETKPAGNGASALKFGATVVFGAGAVAGSFLL